MKRICLLSSVVALFALTAAAEIPAWAERSIAETYARFKAWKGNDEVVVIPTISDIHDFEVESASQPDFARSAFHLLILKRAGEVFKADLTVNLGDLGLDCEGHWAKPSSAAHQAKRLQVEAELVSRFSRPHFELIGNHDHGAATNRITSADFGHLLNPAGASRVKGFVSGGASRDYGYFDFPAKGVRAILLNTSDAIPNTYAISDEQLAFLRRSLAELGKGDNPKSAVIFCHYCIYQQLGRWDASWRANGCKLLGGNLPLAKAAIEEFASSGRIGYVHFRNTSGRLPRYSEVFIDDGYVDMKRAMAIYAKCGYEGTVVPDHSPRLEAQDWWETGMAFALGYIRGIMP